MMSWQAVDAVLSHSRARGIPRLVLIVIADRADDAGRAWPGIEDLARRAGTGRATVFRCLPRLVELGELDIEHRPGRPNRYTVTVTKPVSTSDPSQPATRLNRRPVSPRDPSQFGSKGSQDETDPSHPCDPNDHNGQEQRLPGRGPRPDGALARKREGSTDPRIRPLLDAFCQEHERALGTRYLVVGGRDGNALKRALTTFDEACIRRALPRYFEPREERLRYGAKVPAFVERLAVLLAGSNGHRVRPLHDYTGEGQKSAARGQA